MAFRGKGYEEFLPLYGARCRSGKRYRDVQLPLFPGYVFCRFDPQYRLPILVTPSVLTILGNGKVLVPATASEIAAIQRVVGSGLSFQPWPFLALGDSVYLEEGPLRGMDGQLLDFKGEHRLIVSVSLLQRSLSVVIERRWVRPLQQARCA